MASLTGNIRRLATGIATGEYNGDIVWLTAGVSVAAFDVCHLSSASLAKAKADAEANCDGMLVMALAAYASVAGDFLVNGIIRNTAWTWTGGGLLYVSAATGGLMTHTAPASSGQIVRIVGYALGADIIYFDPDPTYVEI